LIFLVGQGQRRGDGDRIPRVHPHRVDILDRADDDRIVGAVAHDLHFIFLPPDQALVDQNLGRRARLQPGADEKFIFVAVVGDPAAGPAKREARADHRGQADILERANRFLDRMDDRRARAFEPDPVHRVAEFLPVLGLFDRFGVGADQLYPEPVESPVLEQGERGVERGLPAHGRQHRIGPLLLEDFRDDRGGNRLDIGRIGKLGVGHDRRRVRIDDDDPIPLVLQRLDRLASRIIELRRLADDNWAGADDQDRGDVGAPRHPALGPYLR